MAVKVENVREAFAKQKTPSIKCLVAGPPGSGKTRSASTWPNVLYADAEGRLLSIRDRDVRRVEILSTNDLDELKAALDQNPEVRAKMLGGPVETVVIDTVDEIARIIIRERLKAEKKEAMAIQDWGYLGDTLRGILRGYRNLAGVNVVFNVHLKSEEDSETGRITYKPAIQGQVGDQIAEFVDECFMLVARPTIDPRTNERVIQRHLQTYPDPQHNWIKDHSGALPQEFPINFEDDYARLAKLIFGAPSSNGKGPHLEVERVSEALEERAAVEDEKAKAPKKRPSERIAKKAAARPVSDVDLPDEDYKSEPEPLVATPEAATAPLEEPEPPEGIRVVPEVGTPAPSADPLAELAATMPCSVCGKPIESPDYQDLSTIRFGKPLCRKHFMERTQK